MTATQSSTSILSRAAHGICHHWLTLLIALVTVYVFASFAAPVAMKLGATSAAHIIYTFYGTQCHQLPQRSYFLFGEKLTYSLNEINTARGVFDVNPLTLRQFIGDSRVGYKVAFSDRMISLYGSAWLGTVAYATMRGRMQALPIAIASALLLPLAFDGGTHAISDLGGIAGGFRSSNDWLRTLTNNALSQSFYAGDAWGSFNSLMRLITGALAGFAVAFAVLPRVDHVLGIKS